MAEPHKDSTGMENLEEVTTDEEKTVEATNAGENGGSDQKSNEDTPDAEDEKIFNDPIHGFIKLHPLLVAIIDTPQFQRLRDIKQLGVCYWVYPGASHNRFEHCLGTAHLCGKLIDTLRELHGGEIEITAEEALCVKIAGLCHDLGHGPFSHFFDNVYIPYIMNKNKDESAHSWKHEAGSCRLFDFMINSNEKLAEKFNEEFKPDKANYYKDFIKDLISGEPGKTVDVPECPKKKMPKWFLYEIVSNKRNGIDCDKFDYIARDCANVGVKSNFDHRRYFKTIRIEPRGNANKLEICVRDKEVFNIYQLFHTRWSLHKRVCQHKTQAPIEHLLCQAFEKVDKKFHISDVTKGTDEAMKHFTVLTDSVIYDILRSSDPSVSEAQKLVNQIQSRDLYKYCGEALLKPDEDSKLSEEQIAKDLALISKEELKEEQIFVKIIKIDFGMKDEDPVKKVVFFRKSHETFQFSNEQLSQILPQKFNECYVRVYAKSSKDSKQIQTCFEKWCKEQGYPKPHLTG